MRVMNALAATAVVAAICSLAGATCYGLKRTGCGTGLTFCVADTVACDEGWEAITTSGSGTDGNLSLIKPRKCYKISDTLTRDCSQGSPGGSYQQVGCKDGTLCCWAKNIDLKEPHPNGNMNVPDGKDCTVGNPPT